MKDLLKLLAGKDESRNLYSKSFKEVKDEEETETEGIFKEGDKIN